MDEWITIDRFELAKSEQIKNSKNDNEFMRDSERKLTRNQKRKYDINYSVIFLSIGNLFF